MTHLLDTNAVIGIMAGKPALLQSLRRHAAADVAMPAIVLHELFYGAYRSERQGRNLAELAKVRLQVVDFDSEDARQAGEIRAALAAEGKLIGPYDVLIAGQARARDLILVTRNEQEFGRVAGLRMENWED